MTARLPRLVICACALVLVLALIASQMRGSSDREAQVGTEGPVADTEGDEGDERDAARFLPGDGPWATAADTEDPLEERVSTGDGGETTTSTTGGGAGAISTTTTAAAAPEERFEGPDHLRGRLVFVYHEPSPNTLFSSRPDGTDRRIEVPCPLPEKQFGDFPVAVSPDGRWVARTCGTQRPFEDGTFSFGRADVVLQRVDGSQTRVLTSNEALSQLPISWSPDGSTLATASWEAGAVLKLLRVSDGETTTVPMVDLDGNPLVVSSFGNLSWSPDSTRVLVAGPTVVDVRTGIGRSAAPVGWEAPRWGSGDVGWWASDGSIVFRHRPEWTSAEPWVRITLDVDGWPEQRYDTVVAGIEPSPNGAHFIYGPALFGTDTALIVIDQQLWRLDIGPRHPTSAIEPIGDLTLLGDFGGWFLTAARNPVGLATMG